MRIAVIGAGVCGLGAAYLLSRAHEVELFERAARAPAGTSTRCATAASRSTRASSSTTSRTTRSSTRLFRELGVADAGVRDVVLGQLRRLRARVVRPAAVRAARRNAASPRFLSLLWEVGRWLRTARRSLDEADYEERTLDALRRRARLLAAVPHALPRPAHLGALVDRARARARVPGRRTRSASSSNHGMLGFGRYRWRTVTGGAETYVARAARTARAAACTSGSACARVRRTAGRRRAADRRRRGAPLRRRRRRDARATRRFALLADPSDEERRRARRVRVHAERRRAPHRRALPAPRRTAARASWNYQRERRGEADRDVLPEPRSSSSRRTIDYCVTLNRTDEIDPETRSSRARATGTRSSRVESLRRAARAAARSPARGARVRGRVPRQRLPRGRPRVGRARGRRAGGAPGELGALHGHARPRAPRAARGTSFRYPRRVLPARPRRAARARAAPPALLGQPAERRLVPRPRPLRRRRDAAQGGGRRASARSGAGGRARPRRSTQLRVLGYVFNPVTFYWCYGADGWLACMVAELEQHVRRAPARAAATGGASLRARRSGSTSRRSSASTRATSTRSPSRATRCGRGSTCARTARRPLTAVLHGRRRELTNREPRRLPRPLPADAAAGDRRSSTGRR